MNFKKILSTALLLMTGAMSYAAVTTGNYLVKSYNGKYLTENTNTHTLVCSERIEGFYSQVWSVTAADNYVTFKNALTGNVLVFSWDTNAYVTDAPANSAAKRFYPVEADGVYTFAESEGGTWGLHCDNYDNLVGWYVSETKSKWTVEAATVDVAELLQQQLGMAEASADDLTTFFTTTACTALKSTYQAMSDADLRSAMSILPASVQDMAVKVKNNSWATFDGWDKSERTFRIAQYNPYSNHEVWTKILGYGHAFGRLTNPTGIYVHTGEILQVFVDDIAEGQGVSLEVAGYGQASGTTYTLHEGMNTILAASAGNCFVRYEVDNTTSGKAPFTAIADYAPVTLHIEGGTLQGYFDLTKDDDNSDWTQLQAHLLTEETVCLKSSTHVFNLNTELLKTALGTEAKVVEMLDVWTAVAQMQDRLTARDDFDAFSNNLYSVTGHAGSGNPHATTYGTNYYEAAYNGVFNAERLLTEVGGLWTIAHEQGHNRQQLIKLIGTTEISNNTFSNAALDWQGRFTARVYDLQTTFQRWQQGLSWPERVANDGTWECLHMYTQLYQYFHQAGFNTDFYPNLFRAFRTSPMTLTANTPVPASEDYLKFYQTCCEVAQLDLTEFFEVYGFFTLPPAQTEAVINDISTGAYYQEIGDYLTYYIYVSQDMIDQAKAAVAAKGYDKCNIIFIEDRVSAPLASYEGHAEGERRQLSMQDNVFAFGQVGETGQYTSFNEPCSAYAYNVKGTTVTVAGTGAVGFKVYDSTGTLRGIYNTTTFTLPEGLGNDYVIKAAAGNGTDVAATFDSSLPFNPDVAYMPYVWMGGAADRAVTAGEQVTSESDIVSGMPYLIYYKGNGNSGYMKDTKAAYTGAGDNTPTMSAVYVFTDNGDGTWRIQNYATGNFWGTPTENVNAYIGTSAMSAAGAWTLNFLSSGNMAPSANGHSWNRSGSNVHPWSQGTAAVNQFQVYTFTADAAQEPLPEFTHKGIAVGSEPAATVQTGQWYVMFDRGAYHGFLYEKADDHTLYNTATAPGGSANDNARYLVRIVGSDNNYYLQTGYGNYFGAFTQSTPVATTGTPAEAITIRKIAATDGHYYLASQEGVILDANDIVAGDAAVVGYGSTAPTAIGGNNDWAFYPVELTNDQAFFEENVSVQQAYQTTGRGNECSTLLRITLTPVIDATDVTLNIALLDDAQTAAAAFNVYELPTATPEFHAAEAPTLIASATDLSQGSLALNIGSCEADTPRYLWLTAAVKEDADLGAVIDAALASIQFTSGGKEHTLSTAEIGNPEAQGLKVFDVQAYTFLPTTYGSRCYRIPAMIVAADGSILVAADKRYADHQDIGGGRVIDIVLRRSTDGGRTWSDVKTIARGEGQDNLDRCAYGDPTLIRCADGTIVSTACVGNIGYAAGLNRFVVMTSADNGQTWSEPDEPTVDNGRLTIKPTIGGFFITSGKGLLAPDGTLMYLVLTKEGVNYVIYSTDNGYSWTIDDTPVCTGANEAKLEMMNDGSLIASIRTNARRAFNRGSYVNNGDGTLTFTWGAANADVTFASELTTGAGSNQDILYYSRATDGEPDILLHTMAAGTHANLKLFMSLDEGQTWKEAFQLQPGGVRYSALQRLQNGDLAIVFEDGALGQSTPANALVNGYQYPINYITLTRKQIIDAYDAFEDEANAQTASHDVYIVQGMSGETVYGTLAGDTWTSNASPNPVAGLTLTKSDGAFDKYSNWNSHYNLAYHPAAADAEATLTITAPEGYLIQSYSFLAAKASSASHTYTITQADGTVITPAFNAYSTVSATDINAQSTTIGITTSNVSYWLAIADFVVTIVKDGATPTTLTYALVDASGQVVASVEDVEAFLGDEPKLPATMERRPFCTYGETFYKDAACTEPLTHVRSYTSTVYATFDYAGPVEFSTEDNPKWFLLHFREQGDANLYFATANGESYTTTPLPAAEFAYANEAYQWAFIGSPYAAKVVNRATGKPLAAAATSGENGSNLSIGVNDDANNLFSVYGYGGVLGASNGVSNAFTLVLNGSKYAFLTYDGSLKYYSSGVAINGNLALTGWRSSDIMATPAPETYPLALTPADGKSYATLCLPFGVVLPDGVAAYKVAVSGNRAVPTLMGQEVPAETAALLVSEAALTDAEAVIDNQATADASDNALCGIFAATTGADLNGYVLDCDAEKPGFFPLADDSTLPPFRAYLQAEDVGTAEAVIISWNELPVGIGTMQENATTSAETIYNLAGQRLSQPQKGVNIINGKKMMVK